MIWKEACLIPQAYTLDWGFWRAKLYHSIAGHGEGTCTSSVRMIWKEAWRMQAALSCSHSRLGGFSPHSTPSTASSLAARWAMRVCSLSLSHTSTGQCCRQPHSYEELEG